MPLSQKEVDSLIHKLEEDFKKAFTNNDANAIAEMYHPQATFVMTGVKCDFGREAILKTHQEWLSEPQPPYTLFFELNAEAGNGEYLITRGTYVWKDDEKKPFEHVYKKMADGKYLLYHEEFTA